MTTVIAQQAIPCSAPDLIAVQNALADLMQEETAALAAMRLKDATRLKDEKARLTRRYRAQLEELRAKRTALPAAQSPEHLALLTAATRLADVAAENERALRAGRAAVERVVAAIAEAVTSNQKRVASYAPPRYAPMRPPAIAGVAIDRRL
jgi:dTDP-4-amino-4,6-dideoxygalactose transaminase